MNRIKRFGLAAVMALALSGIAGAGSASAAGFETDEYPAAVKGTGSGFSHDFEFQGFATECQTPAVSGDLEYPIEGLETTPTDAECVGNGSLSVNDCDLTFNPQTEVGAGKFTGTIEIGPASCAGISVEVSHTLGWSCEATLQPQSLAASYTTTGAGTAKMVTIGVNDSSVNYTQSIPGGGKNGCTPGTFKNGSWSGTWEARAYKNGSQTGLQVSDKIPTAIAVGGEPTRLEAERYSVRVEGTQLSPNEHQLSVNAGTVSCSTATFSTELGGPSAEVPFAPTYSGCTFGKIGTGTFSTNGCQLVLNIANGGPPSSADAEIACPAGKAIEVVAKAVGIEKCRITIPSQSIAGVSLENSGFGWLVVAEMSLSGIEYKQQEGTGFGRCTGSGTFKNGTYTGTISMRGYS